jgi:hypothetical protein
MKPFEQHLTRFWMGAAGAGLAAALVASAGCATTSPNAMSASLSPAQYAQLSEEECTGVPTKEQELGVLAYRDAVSTAQPLKEEYQVGKTKLTRDRGVQLTVRAQPNVTRAWLMRVATCHVALARSGRITASENDPLLVASATVDVEEQTTGYLVSVHVADQAAAAEVMRRTTLAFTGPSGPATAERLAR